MPFVHLAFPKVSTSQGSAAVGDDWVATEKIHGAQLVVGTDGSEVRVGKRRAWLAPDEPFFGWQIVRSVLTGAARAVHRELGGTGAIWMYGELFGGRYPHPAVPAVGGLVPVQTGIWYSPELDFAVFDVVHEQGSAVARFVAYDRLRDLALAAGLRVAPLLARGKVADLDRLPVRYPSRVPALLGLPHIEANFAEGYVLKPSRDLSVDARPCVKRKLPEFDEQRFDEATPFHPSAYLSRDALFGLAVRLVNDARIASARSKVGTDDDHVIQEVVLDCLVDLHDMLPRRLEALTPEDEEALQCCIAEHARSLLGGNAE